MNDDEELLRKLKEAGFDPSDPQWVTRRNVDLSQMDSLKRQREIMQALRDLLTKNLASDLEQLEEARLSLAKLRRGGGV